MVINPGSTSTKIALFEDEHPIFNDEIKHDVDELAVYSDVIGQHKFREEVILRCLEKNGYRVEQITAVVARGGALRPMASGTYRVNDKMLDDLKNCTYGTHASNLGAILARAITDRLHIEAYIVDPITVSEMDEVATVSGIPEIKRESIFHALNQKAVARMACRDLEKSYADARLIVVHLGGGISVGAHRDGRVIDVNNALNGDGPMAPTRCGSVPEWSLINMAFSGKYSRTDFEQRVMTNGGISAYLGTSDLREVKKKMSTGDHEACLLYEAMAYQVAKEIGSCAAVLEGKVDAIALTGGLARDNDFVNLIKKRTSYIARVFVYPGCDEMRALALGVVRVLRGREQAREY